MARRSDGLGRGPGRLAVLVDRKPRPLSGTLRRLSAPGPLGSARSREDRLGGGAIWFVEHRLHQGDRYRGGESPRSHDRTVAQISETFCPYPGPLLMATRSM